MLNRKSGIFVPLLAVMFICSLIPFGYSTIVPELAWEKTVGGTASDYGRSIQVTGDDGYIIAGYTGTIGGGNWDVYLVKTDSSGNMVWEKTFGGSDPDYGYSVQVTSDGGYIITGSTESFGAGGYDVYLVKTDSSGNLEWEKTFGGSSWDEGFSVQVTSDGGYIITGQAYFSGANGTNVYLVKTDSSGNLEWEKTFGGSGFDEGYSVQVTSDGGYIITGSTESFGAGGYDVYLVKTDSTGDMEWNRTFGGASTDYGRSVQEISDGGYIITGRTTSFGAGEWDVYLVKTDSSGNLLWEKTFGGASIDEGYSVQVTSDGGYIIAGYTHSFGASDLDVYLVKTDSMGVEEWSRTFGGTVWDEGRSVQVVGDGGYIITGTTVPFEGGEKDVYLVKLDSQELEDGNAHELALYEGWNLLSLPITPVDPSIEVVLAGILDKVNSVWAFDGETETWSSYSPGAPSSLTEMADDRGYWIQLTEDATLTVSGEIANTSEIALFEGWNFIGLPLTPEDPSIVAVLADIIDNVESVWTFNGETKTWTSYSPGAPSALSEMVDDRGYWIKVTESTTLTVDG